MFFGTFGLHRGGFGMCENMDVFLVVWGNVGEFWGGGGCVEHDLDIGLFNFYKVTLTLVHPSGGSEVF